jgi:outer membrane receptor for ferrienterochelin and colicin
MAQIEEEIQMHRHITSALRRRPGHRLTAVISIAVLSMAAGTPAYAQDQAASEGVLEEVIVTGFRKSLEEALNIKRDNVGTVDAIVAEDIADWPDQNLAESLQRIPCITITRD